ncbi:DUF5719 family protein [Arthrobacter sp. AZCC_0090]|uniref:DUF5719 family protein n=1 Tax=Arthrobacter sp. AZCC_0090 TaxID=2735881 RepID=UPI001607F13B|nr:DUF5719 family protein [Arthrobacter sp. AZCC_0090]MBB6403621.1 hypothetical protein [Arthrobacter sp. AZCC_0090]
MSDNQEPTSGTPARLGSAEPGSGGTRERGQRKAGNKNRKKNNAVVFGVLSAAMLLAAGAGIVSAASIVPAPAGNKTLDMSLADVPAGKATPVCPAPPRLPEGTAAGTDTQFSPVSRSAKSFLDAVVLSDAAGSVPGSSLASLGGAAIAEIAKAPAAAQTPVPGPPILKAGVVAQRPANDVTVVGADPIGGQKAAVAGLMSYTASDGDLRGLAAAPCQQPGNDAWLLGASTALGRTAVLNISNASGTPATVNLDLYGARGQIQASDSRGLLVSPGTTRSINLAGLAPNEGQLSVHLRSSGGPVASSIQQSILRGLTAGGVELMTPGAAAADSQVMTGVDIQDPAAVKSLAAKAGFSDAVPALQITVPGPADAVLDVRLFGPNGQRAFPGGGAVTAKAGSVTQVPLTGVPAGMYTVSATSDVPFAASTRVTRGLKAEDPVDFAWSPAAVRLGSQHVMAVPQGGTRFLSFGVPAGRATVSYAPVTSDGKVHKTETVEIAGGTTSVIGVPEKSDGATITGYIVSAAGDAAYGALVLGQADQSGVSVLTIQDGTAGHEKVQVTLGY